MAGMDGELTSVMEDQQSQSAQQEDEDAGKDEDEDEKSPVQSMSDQHPPSQDNTADAILDSLIADTADQSQESVTEVDADTADSTLDDVLADVAEQAQAEQQDEETAVSDSSMGECWRP